MSKSGDPGGDWSAASESLFRAARGDYEARETDRARVRDALQRRLSAQVAQPTSVDVGTSEVAPVSVRAVTAAKLAKLTVAVGLVIAGSFSLIQAVRGPAERAPSPAASSAPVVAQSPPTRTVSSMTAPDASDAPTSQRQGQRARATQVRSELAQQSPVRPSPRSVRVRPAPIASAPRSRPAAVQSRPPPDRSQLASVSTAAAQPGVQAPAESAPRNLPVPLVDPNPPAAVAALPQARAAEPTVRNTLHANDEPVRAAVVPDPRAELVLVQRIHAAMREGEPAAALTLCAEHARRWPNGTFVLEREGVRAIASCKLRENQARERARAFLAAHPNTPLAHNVTGACSLLEPSARPR